MSKELVEAVQSKDPVKVSEAFNEAMKSKVREQIVQVKVETLKKVLTGEE